MKLLAFADTQIGVATVDLQDQADVLARIVDVALEHEVYAVLHGGDVFEGPHVTPEQMRVFLDGIQPLRIRGIPILVIRGNGRHDSAVRKVHALDVLRELHGITVHDRPGVWRPYGLSDGLAVCTLPWVHPGRLLATLEGKWEHDHANEMIGEGLVRVAAELAHAAGDDAKILLAHWAITGAKLPSGLSVEEMREPVIPWAELDTLGYDLIVGAHIHEPQWLSDPNIDQTPGLVLGSPQQLNHGERGDHGCWLVDLSDHPPAAPLCEFVPIESPRFVTVDAHIDERDEWVEEWDLNVPITNAIIRVRYTATEEQARRIDHDAIRDQWTLIGAKRVTIEPNIIRAARARSEQMTEQLGPVEALAAYCDAQEIADPLRGRMLARLEEWIAG